MITATELQEKTGTITRSEVIKEALNVVENHMIERAENQYPYAERSLRILLHKAKISPTIEELLLIESKLRESGILQNRICEFHDKKTGKVILTDLVWGYKDTPVIPHRRLMGTY